MGFRSYRGYTHSENGWRICDVNETHVITVAGMNLRVRRGFASEALRAWVLWYHENVEPIDRYKSPPTYTDDWGWSFDNDVANSNHLSGTAVDLNATQYPWGLLRMPLDRVAKVREGLQLFQGIIYWGRNWGKPDEMHYQLNGGTASGDGASERLVQFVRNHIKDGRLVTPGAKPEAPTYDPKVVDAYKQVSDRFGWWA